MATSSGEWEEFYEKTRGRPPHELVVEAVGHVARRGRALDVGAGALNDTRYLLAQGFDVTAVDASDLMIREAADLPSRHLHAVLSSFEEFDFGADLFDLASAMYSLPFNPPHSYDTVFARIVASLAPRGVFCGVFFGNHDTWASNPEMTFHTRAQAETRLAGLEIIKFAEREEDGSTSVGVAKHWHTFEFIVRKSGP